MKSNGLSVRHKPIETVQLNGVEVSLLAAGDGTEVIRHRMLPGTQWALTPQEAWTGCESVVLISGELALIEEPNGTTLKAGDTVSASPILQEVVFQAVKETEFVYVTSQPVFHLYSRTTSEIIQLAVSVEQKDGYTADHCNRIKEMAMLVGHHMRLTSTQLFQLNFGSFFHDIGKVKVPIEILNKPGKLTDAEWVEMKRHTDYGEDMLMDTGMSAFMSAANIVKAHHERWDGRGYHGVQGDEIPLGACIVAVVDSFDAMTTDRVYQKGRPVEEGFSEIRRCREVMYRPDVVDAFIELEDQIAKQT